MIVLNKLDIYTILLGVIFILLLFINLDFFNQNEVLSKWYTYHIMIWFLFAIFVVSESELSFRFDNITIWIIVLNIYILIRKLTSDNVDITVINPLTFIVSFIIFKKISYEAKYIDSIIILACLIQAIYGFMQYFGVIHARSDIGVMGSFDNPAGFAACLTMGFPFALNSLNKKSKYNYLNLACIIILASAILLSKSRTGVLALIIISILYLYDRYLWSYQKQILAFISFISVVALTIVFLFFLNKHSSNGRVFIWMNSINMLKDNYLFGNGVNYFNKYYMLNQASYFEQNPNSHYLMLADNVFHPFNEYILFLIEYGIAGFFILVVISFIIIRDKKLVLNIYYLPIVSIGIFSCFSYPFKYPFAILVMTFCLSKISIQTVRNRCITFTNKLKVPLLIMPILSLLLLYQDIIFEVKWKELVRLSSLGKITQTVDSYSALKEKWNHNPLFLYNYGALLFRLNKYPESLNELKECEKFYIDYDVQLLIADNYNKLGMIKLAEKHYFMAHNMIPHRFIPLSKLFHLYIENNNYVEASKIARIITNKEIKIQSMTISQIIDEAEYYLQHN